MDQALALLVEKLTFFGGLYQMTDVRWSNGEGIGLSAGKNPVRRCSIAYTVK